MTETAPQRPLKVTAEQVRKSLGFFKFMAILTGVLLLLVCVEMIAKYGFGYEFMLGNVNLSKTITIVHGWCFVAYLIADLRLFLQLRWNMKKFLLVALGGVVPVMSFIMERRVHREVRAQLGSIEEMGPRY